MISLGPLFVSDLPYVATYSQMLLVAKTVRKSRALGSTAANPMAIVGEGQAIEPAEILSELQTMDEPMGNVHMEGDVHMEEDVRMEDDAGLFTPVSTPGSPTPTVHQSLPGRSTPEPSFMHCQTRPSTTLVSTPGSPTPTVHQPSPGRSTPEPSFMRCQTRHFR